MTVFNRTLPIFIYNSININKKFNAREAIRCFLKCVCIYNVNLYTELIIFHFMWCYLIIMEQSHF